MKKLIIKLIVWIISKLDGKKAEVIEIKPEVDEIKAEVAQKREKFTYTHKRGRLVWNSKKQGTYVHRLHGELA